MTQRETKSVVVAKVNMIARIQANAIDQQKAKPRRFYKRQGLHETIVAESSTYA